MKQIEEKVEFNKKYQIPEWYKSDFQKKNKQNI